MKDIELKIKLDAADSANSIKDIKKSIKDLNNAALEVGQGGEGFDALTKKAGELKNKLGDLNETTNALNGSGVEKLTAGMNLLKESISTANPEKLGAGFKVVGAAMKAIPIFLIIEGIKFLIENFEKLTQSGGIVGKVFGFIKDVIDSVIQAFKDLTDWLGLTNNAIEDNAEKTIEAAKKTGEAVESRYNDEIKLAKAAGKETTELEIKKQQAIIESARIQVNALKAVYQANGTLTDAQTKQLEGLVKTIHDAQIEVQAQTLAAEKKTNDEQAKLDDEANKKRAEAYKKHQADLLKTKQDRQKLEEDIAAKALAEQIKNDAAELKATEDLIAKVRKLKEDEELRLAGSEQAKLDIKKQRDIEEIEAEYAKTNLGIEAQQAKADALLAIEGKYNDDVNTLRTTTAQKQAEIDKQEEERKKALREKELNDNINTATNSANALIGLNDLVFSLKSNNLKKGSKAEDDAARKHFQVNKALQLGLAVIDGFKAITTSLSQSPIAIGPVPNPAGIASLAFAAVTAAVNIAKIASSQYKSSGGGAEGASAPSVPTASTPSSAAPNTNTTFSGTPLQKIGENPQNQPARVYVVSTDLTHQQNADAVLERRSTLVH